MIHYEPLMCSNSNRTILSHKCSTRHKKTNSIDIIVSMTVGIRSHKATVVVRKQSTVHDSGFTQIFKGKICEEEK